MSQLPRKTQLVFGGSLAAANNIAVFGSLALGTPGYSLDPAAIQSAEWLDGWSAAVINTGGGQSSPALQDFNALFYQITLQLSYVFQAGIPEWDPNVPYYFGSLVQGPAGTAQAGIIYQSNSVPVNTNHAVTMTNWWTPYALTVLATPSAATLAAWIIFDSRTATIIDSFNLDVSTPLVNLGSSLWQINFGAALLNANYMWQGSIMQIDNTSFLDTVSRFLGDVKTTTAFQFRVLNGGTSAPTTSPEVNISLTCNPAG